MAGMANRDRVGSDAKVFLTVPALGLSPVFSRRAFKYPRTVDSAGIGDPSGSRERIPASNSGAVSDASGAFGFDLIY